MSGRDAAPSAPHHGGTAPAALRGRRPAAPIVRRGRAPAVDLSNVGGGWVVYRADDRKVGEVREVRDTYLVVRQGMILGQWLYPPLSAVARAERGSVHLAVAEDELGAQGWDEQPQAPA